MLLHHYLMRGHSLVGCPGLRLIRLLDLPYFLVVVRGLLALLAGARVPRVLVRGVRGAACVRRVLLLYFKFLAAGLLMLCPEICDLVPQLLDLVLVLIPRLLDVFADLLNWPGRLLIWVYLAQADLNVFLLVLLTHLLRDQGGVVAAVVRTFIALLFLLLLLRQRLLSMLLA